MKDELPHGSTVEISGQAANMVTAYRELLVGLVAAVVLIYLLLVINFQSWLIPFIIITALPGALAGIAWALFLTHTNISVPALTGAIMAMGTATAIDTCGVLCAGAHRRAWRPAARPPLSPAKPGSVLSS